MTFNIKTSKARAKLGERAKAYFYRLGPNTPWSLGYRRTTAARVWVLRYRDTKTNSYRMQRIAVADDSSSANGRDILNFEQAIKLAEQTYEDIIAGAPDGPTLTVEQAVYGVRNKRTGKRTGGYIADREAEGRNTSTAVTALEAHILPQWRDARVADLTAAELKAWRDELVMRAPRARTSQFADQQHSKVNLDDPEVKRRRRSTVNRVTTTFKAVLNYAARMDSAEAPNRDAWREGLKAFREVDVPRDRWLTTDEVVRLLNACRPNFRRLVQAALYTGCRYGELCRAKIGDYSGDLRALHIPISKSGKSRDVILHDEGASFFESLTIGRGANEWMLTRTDPVVQAIRRAFGKLSDWSEESITSVMADISRESGLSPGNVSQRLQLALKSPASTRTALGLDETLRQLDASLAQPWRTSHQSRPMADACRIAKIRPPISFHGLRHTYASLAIQSGMALIALAHNLGHSSTRMVERHYGHLSNDYMREQVANHAPKFGFKHGDAAVRPLQPRNLPK